MQVVQNPGKILKPARAERIGNTSRPRVKKNLDDCGRFSDSGVFIWLRYKRRREAVAGKTWLGNVNL